MKRIITALVAAIVLVCAPADAAQKSAAVIKAESVAKYQPNGARAIGPLDFANTFSDIADSFGNILSANTWAGTQTFSMLPIFVGCTGLAQGNNTSPIGCLSASSAKTFLAITSTDVTHTPSGSAALPQSLAYRGAQIVLATDYMSPRGNNVVSGTINSGSTSLTVSDATEFVNKQGLLVFYAGPTPTVPNPTGVSATQNGATGSTNYTYRISSIDYDGGIRAPVTVSVTNGNATLSTANNVTISLTPGSGGAGYIVWKSTSGGAYVYVGGGVGGLWVDTGWVPGWRPLWIPATPPGADQADWLVTSVVSGGQSKPGAGDGTTTLVLANAASNSVVGQRVQHDETAAWNSLNTLFAASGATVHFPCGIYNTSRRVQVTNSFLKFEGEGQCSIFQPYGSDVDVVFQGASASSFIRGNGYSNFYVKGYNKLGGGALYVQWTQTFENSNTFWDVPWTGPSYYGVNDIRSDHNRIVNMWGFGGWTLNVQTGSTGSDYACCFLLNDFYANNLASAPGGGGMRTGGYGFRFDGNVATVLAFNSAVSNAEGHSLAISNNIANATPPQFFHWYGYGSEFPNGRAISLDAGREIYFTDPVMHGAKNGNSNVVINTGVTGISFTGGRNGGATGHCYQIYGSNIKILGQSIFNCSSPPSTTGVYSGIILAASARRVVVNGNFIGQEYASFGVTWQHAASVTIEAGANEFAVTGNVFAGNVSNPPINGAGTAASRVVANNAQ